MLLDNIHAGLKVKNYPSLCRLLGEPIKNGGTSKTAQLKEWRRFFSWEMEGRAFVITKVFDYPHPKPFRVDDEYTEDILVILHEHFNGSGTEVFFSSRLFSLLGFTNGREIREKRIGETRETPFRFGLNDYDYRLIQNNFNYHVSVSLGGVIRASLDRLQTREYLKWKSTVELKSVNGIWHHATSEEAELFREIDKTVRERLGIKHLSQWKYRAYDNAMEEALAQHGLLAARRSITIIYNPMFQIDSSNFDAHKSRRRINEKVVSKMLGYIDTDIQRDVNYKAPIFEDTCEDVSDEAWIFDYFYPTLEDKYIGISSGTMDDLRDARRELVDMYIALDGAVTRLEN